MTIRTLSPFALIALLGVSALLPGAAPAQEDNPLAQAAFTILKKRCFACHGQNGVASSNLFVLDHARLVKAKWILPGDRNSPLLRQVETGAMPRAADKLPETEISILRRWIDRGAPAFVKENPGVSRAFLSEADLLRHIEADLNQAEKRDRLYLRYYSIAHLYNAGVTDEELTGYRLGLAKLLNSLSWHREITRPIPIDPEKTLLRIDLRDFNWTPDTWKIILAAYPYGVRTPDTERITRLSGATLPYVRADWFVANASVPPLYHDILELPHTVQELEKRLGVNVERNLEHGKNAVRGGVRNSGVSRNNRVVERHISAYGAYWRSYDFSTNQGEQNIFKNPLHFKAAGGEMIFHLPNGMQAYFLADAKGERLDAAPIAIVFDRNTREEAEIRNGRSCMACHFAGMRPFKDDVRVGMESQSDAPYDRDRALALYVPQPRLDAFLKEDVERFQRAVEATGSKLSADFSSEPINTLATKFNAELTLAQAAAEAGMVVPTFRERISKSKRLAELGFGQLLVENGGYKRDAWSEYFPHLVAELSLGDYIRPLAPIRAIAQSKGGNAPSTRINPQDNAEMVYIPPGPFLMGTDEGEAHERPAHRVNLSGYYIYKYPVTVAQYFLFCSQTGRPMPPAPNFNPNWQQQDHPMVNVTWSDALAYARWAKGSLPTEAQWEKAARGGLEGKEYPWGKEFDRSQLRCSKEMSGDAGSTSRVGAFPPNGYGLYDMAGNVWHWCYDRYDALFYLNTPDTLDPICMPPGQYRVLRGGSWQNFTPKYYRAAYRLSASPDITNFGTGFRCVWQPDK